MIGVNMDIKDILLQVEVLLPSVKDEVAKKIIESLFGIIEEQHKTITELKTEKQNLRDENNSLKKELGKPDIKPNNRDKNKKDDDDQNSDHSSEDERKNKEKKKKHKKSKKKSKIKIDREIICNIDKSTLPDDAEFKYYEDVTVQDIIILTNNTLFKKEVWYSPSQKKTYSAPLPKGFEGEFGPIIKAFIINQKHVCNMSEPKILEMLTQFNIHISAGTISNILTKNNDVFHKEKEDIVNAGILAKSYTQTDDTGARVKGENYHTHVLTNSLFSAFFTEEKKNRLTVLKVLQNNKEFSFIIDEQALEIAKRLNVGKKDRNILNELKSSKYYLEEEFEKLLAEKMPKLKNRNRQKILESAAISAYQKRTDIPIISILICDDAPQFKLLTEELSLCWVHEARHYKKLSPIVPSNERKLKDVLTKLWDYYGDLLKYKEKPTDEMKESLDSKFDEIFSIKTDYKDLDNRLSKTLKKKKELLLVLEHPEIPIHNNDAELSARVQVRKRDVSLHTMSDEGTKSLDTFMTIIETCRKNSINAFDYILDRVQKSLKMKPLADIIKSKTTAF